MALQRFGPFELERRLGVGGMAETFVAVKRGPGGFEQKVCVKRILPALENDAEFVRLFLEEARLAAQLRHANVVQVIDFGAQDGQHYMALELVEGCDLRALLKGLAARGETLTSGVLVFIATELAQALDFAHARPSPIVHRDVSPSNVLLSFAGEVKLSDFGIARAVKGNEFTSTAQVKGKVPYMAPEYAIAGRVDPRVDLFALGIVLYESLAGRRPYDGATDFDTLRRIESGEHVPLAKLCPTVPQALVEAIERLISPSADARFATANDFLDALVDVAPPPTARRILAELVRRIARVEAPSEPSVAPPDAAVDPVAHTAPAVTVIASPRGTQLAPGVAPVQVAEKPAVVAGPTDPTRTRAPPPGEIARAETALLGPPPSADSPRTDVPSATVAPTEVSTFDPPPETPMKRATSRPLVLGASALAVVALLSVGAWAVLGDHGHGAHGNAAPDLNAAVVPPPAPVVAPPPPLATDAGSVPLLPAAPDAGDTRPAHLSITAYPFGAVAIDGVRHGRSPVEADVDPGHHVVTVTNGSVVRQRSVDVRAGQRRPLTVDME